MTVITDTPTTPTDFSARADCVSTSDERPMSHPPKPETVELAAFVAAHVADVGALADDATAGMRRRYAKLLRTRQAVAALIANGVHLDLPGDAKNLRFVMGQTRSCATLTSIDSQNDWWSAQARRCHAWRGHTHSLPAERPQS